METVLKFDKVTLTKELNETFCVVGESFEIANVLDDAFLLRNAKTKIAIGVVSFKDFEKHFAKAEGFKGWTPWTKFMGFDGQNDCFYKTNGRKVYVKFLANKVRAESCCHRDDTFSLSHGIHIAYLRAMNKVLAKKKAEYEKTLDDINREMAENNVIIKKMINMLEGK